MKNTKKQIKQDYMDWLESVNPEELEPSMVLPEDPKTQKEQFLEHENECLQEEIDELKKELNRSYVVSLCVVVFFISMMLLRG
jgi:vacuolar-type H+-ATPase subunit C/Vma6